MQYGAWMYYTPTFLPLPGPQDVIICLFVDPRGGVERVRLEAGAEAALESGRQADPLQHPSSCRS